MRKQTTPHTTTVFDSDKYINISAEILPRLFQLYSLTTSDGCILGQTHGVLLPSPTLCINTHLTTKRKYKLNFEK